MEEFLLQYKNTITFSVEILAAVTGLVLYKNYKPTAAKYFIWFLVYLSICDFTGSYVYYIKNDGLFSFLQGTRLTRNFWFSTLFWKIGAILFFVFYYNKVLETKGFRKIITYCGCGFLVFSIIYILTHWEMYFNTFFPVISVFGAIIIFLCTAFYFIEVLQSDKILSFYRTMDFYISFAIFIWWLIITPLVFYDIYISKRDWNFIFLRRQIYLVANILMYLTFTFALLWCRPKNG